jgi:hypothetical protein
VLSVKAFEASADGFGSAIVCDSAMGAGASCPKAALAHSKTARVEQMMRTMGLSVVAAPDKSHERRSSPTPTGPIKRSSPMTGPEALCRTSII